MLSLNSYILYKTALFFSLITLFFYLSFLVSLFLRYFLYAITMYIYVKLLHLRGDSILNPSSRKYSCVWAVSSLGPIILYLQGKLVESYKIICYIHLYRKLKYPKTSAQSIRDKSTILHLLFILNFFGSS